MSVPRPDVTFRVVREPGTQEIPFEQPEDPLYRSVPLPHVVTLPVLGIQTRFETNSAAVMTAVEHTFGGWRCLSAHPELISPTRVRLRVFVHEGAGETQDPAALTYRMPDPNRLLVAGPGSFGVAEVDRGEAYAFVTPDLVKEETEFRYGMLEAVTFTLLTPAERYPFHAALVELDGVAILLSGPSGSGKSTLAYAASRTGFRVIGEEVAFVQLQPRLRIWGAPARLRLGHEAAAHFPELNGLVPTRLPDGTNKISLHVPFDASSPPPVAERFSVCFLAKDSGVPSLTRLAAPEVERTLTGRLDPGFDRDLDLAARAAARLAERGGWRVQLSADPLDGVALLREIVEAAQSET